MVTTQMRVYRVVKRVTVVDTVLPQGATIENRARILAHSLREAMEKVAESEGLENVDWDGTRREAEWQWHVIPSRRGLRRYLEMGYLKHATQRVRYCIRATGKPLGSRMPD